VPASETPTTAATVSIASTLGSELLGDDEVW
jgi:hypothetical protein